MLSYPGNVLRTACLSLVLAGAAAPLAAMERLQFQTPGASSDLRESLRAASLLAAARAAKTKDSAEILAAAQADYGRLIAALYADGFFGSSISIQLDGREAAEISPLAAPARVTNVRVRVDPGPRYVLGQAQIAPLASPSHRPPSFRTGQPARTTVLEDATKMAIDGWRGAGRPIARVAEQQITARHDEDRLDVLIRIDPGPVATFGDLEVSGAKRTKPERIREIAGFPKGKTYDPEQLELVAERLRRTGTFSSVTITEASEVGPDGELDVALELAEQKKRRLGAGIEVSTNEGVVLSAFWLHRNLFRGAERFQIDGEIAAIGGETGGTDYSLGARFTRPGTRNADTELFVTGLIEQLNEPDFTSKAVELGVGLSRNLRRNLSGEAGVRLSFAEVTDGLGTEEYRHIFFPIAASWERRNDPVNPSDGFYMSGELAPFAGLSGSESGTRATLDARGYQALPDEQLVLAARVQLGTIMGASITGLPNDMRFTSGGGGTVRGQSYQSLNVDLGGGATSGGRGFLGLSGELRYAVNEDFQAVGFVDWGHISADSTPGANGNSHAGAGLGLRYNTGIGPIRFDLAVPISGDSGGSNYQIYIGIGQAF